MIASLYQSILKTVDSLLFWDNAFKFSVKTDNTGTSNNDQFTIPTVSGGVYDCTVYWGDGSADIITTWNDAAWTHTYSSNGTYEIRIVGIFKGLSFYNAGDEEKLLNISQWGLFNPNNSTSVFYGCSNLTITATDAPDFTGVTTLVSFFRSCSSLTTVPSMNSWDVSNITSIQSMLNECAAFSQDINNWDTSSITNMAYVFQGCNAFNNSLSNWNTSSVTNMNTMFAQMAIFNQDLSAWNTSSVTNMSVMFFGMGAFDQDLSSWDVTSLTTATNMLAGTTLSTANYNSLLDGWESQSVQNTVTFHGGNSTYSSANGAEGRFNLVNDHTWTITDGGSINEFTFDVKTDNAGTSTSTQFTMPTVSGGSYDCFVEWKSTEGSRITTYDDAAWTHEFTSSSTYTVSIYGTISGIKFNNGGDRLKFLLISQWGTFIPADQNSIFYGCSNLTITATDVFDLSTTTNLHGLFRDCSSITTIPSIESWDTSGLINIFNLFNGATNFNDDVSGWDTSSATSLASMFKNASSFDQDLGSWDVTSITNAANMFNGVTLSTVNYSSILTGWEGQSVQNTVTFHGGSSLYSAGAAATARADLVADHTWTITDGGQA